MLDTRKSSGTTFGSNLSRAVSIWRASFWRWQGQIWPWTPPGMSFWPSLSLSGKASKPLLTQLSIVRAECSRRVVSAILSQEHLWRKAGRLFWQSWHDGWQAWGSFRSLSAWVGSLIDHATWWQTRGSQGWSSSRGALMGWDATRDRLYEEPFHCGWWLGRLPASGSSTGLWSQLQLSEKLLENQSLLSWVMMIFPTILARLASDDFVLLLFWQSTEMWFLLS